LRRAALLLAVLTLVPAASAHATAPRWRACSNAPGFSCTVLGVPLDRTGRLPGRVHLHVAELRGGARPGRVLIALSGGPGQSTIGAAPFVAQALTPALRRYRLVVLDQRGTGASDVLRCPALQRLSLLEVLSPQRAAACANLIGPRRDAYSTTDSVDDLEAVRRALGVEKIALQGTSYGTYVAVQYARRYPQHVDRLILDSVVGPAGVDPLLLDSYGAVTRVLGTEICGAGACRGIDADPVGDLRALASRTETRALHGRLVGHDGRPHAAKIGAIALVSVLFASDLNPHLQAALPAALRSGALGDAAPLLRLMRPAAGGPLSLSDLSAGLNAATTCDDTALDYPLSSPVAERPQRIRDAVAAADAARLGPFSRALVARTSVDEQCRLWPPGTPAPQSTGPLPDVPALVLSGRTDLRTPTENARAIAALLPHATLVTVPGNGHDEIDTDQSGCVARALRRWIGGRPVGAACASTSNAVPPQPFAPTRLARLAPAPGTAGARGRVLAAALGAVNDARQTYLTATDAGFADDSGGGLRAGFWRLAGDSGLAMHGVAWIPGVRVSGVVSSRLGRYAGHLRVSAPHGLGGRLTFDVHRGITGVLGGRRVHLSARYAHGTLPQAVRHQIGR
jgi:pimeloyl-ACP methyl ester carboxylesterase